VKAASKTLDRTPPSASPLSRLRCVLRPERNFSLAEIPVVLVAIAAVAFVTLAPHLQHGGFYLDDWSNAAMSLQPPGSPNFGNALSAFAEVTIFRPVLVVYVPLTYFVFGMHMHYHLAFAAVLAVLAAGMFYGVLRVLGVPWLHALLLATLAIVFPWSDSTRLWATADQLSLSILFMMGGLFVALLGLEREHWRWHGCALGLYLLSILTYEVTLPVIACAGILYCLRVGWRGARWRWLSDLAVVAAAGIWVGTHTARTASSLEGNFEHLRQIISAGGTILGRAGMPLGTPHSALVLSAVAIVLGVGFCAYRFSPERFATGSGWGLRNWLLLTVGGVGVAALGWVMFIPADPYYTPTIFGETNRVNALAAFGLILAVYGTFGTFGSLIGQIRPQMAMLASAVTVCLGIVLLASYAHVLRRHIEIWNLAFFAETYALTKTREVLPHLPPGATVFASGYPANQSLGVPILATTWDFDGMVKMKYDDSSLSASPVLPGLYLACRANGVALEREGKAEVKDSYGDVRLLDLQTGKHSAPKDQRECREVVSRYVPGPLYLSLTY
jgi:hypothetical protein